MKSFASTFVVIGLAGSLAVSPICLADGSAQTCSALVASIVDSQPAVSVRVKAVAGLSPELNGQEKAMLFKFLKASEKNERNLPALALIKNNLLNYFQREALPSKDLTALMIEMAEDIRLDKATRDYVLQHLGVQLSRSSDGEEAEKIETVLLAAAHEHSSRAGTALLALHRCKTSDGELNRQIDSLALNMVSQAGSVSSCRTTAVQVCAERNLKEALPSIQALVESGQSFPLRISAISALGQFGNRDQVVVLEELKRQGSPKLQPAISSALRKLQLMTASATPL